MDQIERTERYLDRIRQMYDAVPDRDDAGKYYGDDVASFFMHCYHIRDWIIELNRVGATRDEVDTFIDEHEDLRVCADLCNRAKHCELHRRTRTGLHPHVATMRRTGYQLEDGQAVTTMDFGVMAGEEMYDALELAESCMQSWGTFVRQLEERAASGQDADAAADRPSG